MKYELLKLQRASAGSGKTFTLAKQFLWFYLTIRPEEGVEEERDKEERVEEERGKEERESGRRLRTAEELRDSAGHILAVTFTNKATTEMQERIVNKLFALGAYDPHTDTKKPDYLEDFARDLGVSEQDVQHTARLGLRILLENYSDFRVSTIDSFFQTVLRTLAYETNINDGYRVELEGDYITREAINAILEDIDSRGGDRETNFWIRELMRNGGDRGWNIFQRKEKGGSAYASLTAMMKNIENEEYKDVRGELEKYAAEHGSDLIRLYTKYQQRYTERFERLATDLAEQADRLEAALPDDLLSAGSRTDLGKFALIITKIRQEWVNGKTKYNILILDDAYYTRKGVVKYFDGNPQLYTTLRPITDRLNACAEELISLIESAEYKQWQLYAPQLPKLGLMNLINRKREQILGEGNAIELGETAKILSDIIGDSDAPFVYERLGTYLNHFLIDEFQDTSRLQWQNMAHLVRESIGRGNENLIIGDAKQSIYRFRNADPSLITDAVPSEFGIRPKNDPETLKLENSNWRSAKRIVEFNNALFKHIAENFGSGDHAPGRIDFTALYGNVEQYIRAKEESGYVEIRQYKGTDEEYDKQVVAQTIATIVDMRRRGYPQRDIAVLVRTNAQATTLIEGLLAHNNDLAEGETPIAFMSEDSLKLANAPAVRTIVSVLESISRGAEPEIEDDEETRRKRSVGRWNDMECNYRYYAMNHPEKSAQESMAAFINEGSDFNALDKMLAEMQSVALPALVEATVAGFLTPEVRQRDAVFIAAFQDLVIEYCENRETDIGSFLEWWGRKQAKATIAQPEGTEAVSIMTIHKSKGLEFRCVIEPYHEIETEDKVDTREWHWVEPGIAADEGDVFPPRIPVQMTPDMEGTIHEPMLREHLDQVKMDSLNTAYVAHTRAVDELYIYTKYQESAKEGRKPTVYDTFAQSTTAIAMTVIPGEDIMTYGERPEQAERRKDPERVYEMTDYESKPTPGYMKFKEENLPGIIDVAELGDGEEIDIDQDPRSAGNLRHAILEQVETRGDLERAVRRLKITGVIGAAEQQPLIDELGAKLDQPAVRGWFDGSQRVINERWLVRSANGQGDRHPYMRRPDRVMIDADRNVTVVDYKFGKVRTDKRYARQVREYVERLKDTGQYKTVTGYLWYVAADELQLISN